MIQRLKSRIVPAAFGLAIVLMLALAGQALAHAELVSSDPTDGASLPTSPAVITAIYSEEIDPGRSSISLRDQNGNTLATGGFAQSDPKGQTMSIDLTGPLVPGTYALRWTTVTTDDNGVERGTFSFTVTGGESPLPSATPAGSAPTPASSPTPGGSSPPSGAPSVGPATQAPPTPTGAPAPSPSGATNPPASGGDTLLPVVVAGVVVLGAAAFLLLRRRGADGGGGAGSAT